MIALLFLAAQMLPATPLPPQMESAVERYGACVQVRWRAEVERRFASHAAPAPEDGSRLMDEAIAACAGDRARSVELADTALATARGFEDSAYRRRFIRERFDSLDSMMRWSITPEGDPDNWNPDADD